MRMKAQVDKQRREVELQEGEWAFVRLQPYRQLSLQLKKQQKLSPRVFRPYRILKCVGPVAYKLENPDSTQIHPVFHVSQLKCCRGQPLQHVTHVPLLMEPNQPEQDTTVLNLEDKVPNLAGGDVMAGLEETQESMMVTSPREDNTEELMDQDQPMIKGKQGKRKGTIERK
ncbi:hypothetical protein GQ457_05G024260 [Hibiscus cannabinus]